MSDDLPFIIAEWQNKCAVGEAEHRTAAAIKRAGWISPAEAEALRAEVEQLRALEKRVHKLRKGFHFEAHTWTVTERGDAFRDAWMWTVDAIEGTGGHAASLLDETSEA
jgi:hypothetical protein